MSIVCRALLEKKHACSMSVEYETSEGDQPTVVSNKLWHFHGRWG